MKSSKIKKEELIDIDSGFSQSALESTPTVDEVLAEVKLEISDNDLTFEEEEEMKDNEMSLTMDFKVEKLPIFGSFS